MAGTNYTYDPRLGQSESGCWGGLADVGSRYCGQCSLQGRGGPAELWGLALVGRFHGGVRLGI